MKRVRLMMAMLGLAGMVALVVRYASPYAPVVGAAPENIEDLWAIEGARQESDVPLVTALENHGVPLAYETQTNTFYCTLGLNNGEAWPEIHLTAPGVPDVQLVFSDDYTYDWCQDAIRDGYAYQVMAYNDTHFAYFDVIFTGLPLMMLTADREITVEDAPIGVQMAVYGQSALRSHGRAHIRGASTLNSEKKAYKVEFTREADGRKQTAQQVPGFGAMEAINLNPMVHDELLVREKLSWDLYESLVAHDQPFGARRTQYAEVFLNGDYQGIYLMVEPMDCERELSKEATRAMTDSVYRTAVLSFSRDRVYQAHRYRANTGYELYYHPAVGTADPFAMLQLWMDMNRMNREGDFEALESKALSCIDLDSMIAFDLFIQAAGMTDNVFNNMYIIAHPTAAGLTYTFAPWDMDMTWGRKKAEVGENFENWIYFPIADRLIDRDAGGVMRDKVTARWQQMRESVFNEDTINRKLEEYAHILGDSGAWARNAARWNMENYMPDFYNITVFIELRFALMDAAIAAISDKGNKTLAFLANTQYEGKGTPIVLE